MSYQIEITLAARREIRVLPAHVRSQAVQLIDELERDPKPARAKEPRDRANIHCIWLAACRRVLTLQQARS
jgi:mRNA-degrading endonuclease RelE of RelBE toxin-antitoxin system